METYVASIKTKHANELINLAKIKARNAKEGLEILLGRDYGVETTVRTANHKLVMNLTGVQLDQLNENLTVAEQQSIKRQGTCLGIDNAHHQQPSEIAKAMFQLWTEKGHKIVQAFGRSTTNSHELVVSLYFETEQDKLRCMQLHPCLYFNRNTAILADEDKLWTFDATENKPEPWCTDSQNQTQPSRLSENLVRKRDGTYRNRDNCKHCHMDHLHQNCPTHKKEVEERLKRLGQRTCYLSMSGEEVGQIRVDLRNLESKGLRHTEAQADGCCHLEIHMAEAIKPIKPTTRMGNSTTKLPNATGILSKAQRMALQGAPPTAPTGRTFQTEEERKEELMTAVQAEVKELKKKMETKMEAEMERVKGELEETMAIWMKEKENNLNDQWAKIQNDMDEETIKPTTETREETETGEETDQPTKLEPLDQEMGEEEEGETLGEAIIGEIKVLNKEIFGCNEGEEDEYVGLKKRVEGNHSKTIGKKSAGVEYIERHDGKERREKRRNALKRAEPMMSKLKQEEVDSRGGGKGKHIVGSTTRNEISSDENKRSTKTQQTTNIIAIKDAIQELYRSGELTEETERKITSLQDKKEGEFPQGGGSSKEQQDILRQKRQMWLYSKLNKYTNIENYIEADNETHKHNKEERNTTTNKKPEKRQKERTTTQNTKKHKTATLPAGPQKKRPIEQEETMEEATIGDNEGTADSNSETLPEQEQTPDFARRKIRSNPNKMELSVATYNTASLKIEETQYMLTSFGIMIGCIQETKNLQVQKGSQEEWQS
ncbi:hypothetical protein BDR26DRAFT_907101 [Obelidium mucronatum]|nr:hypothetical protein BDR26DRAFT_907101 [Obelidium mucronatum]